MLLLQADVVAESDAVTSHNHQHVSAAAESHQDESLSNRSCQEGIVNNCQNIAVNAAMCTLCPKKKDRIMAVTLSDLTNFQNSFTLRPMSLPVKEFRK